jgi:CheY-like chemotaxis protein
MGARGTLFKPVSYGRLSSMLGAIAGVRLGSGHGTGHGFSSYEANPERLAGVRVLVAEDNTVNQMVVDDLLRSAGADVVMVENGRLAVEALLNSADAFDLVLMDLQMPEMDGVEATRRIRQEERFAKLPIVALTAHAFAGELQNCRDAGMNDHLTKPITPHSFFSTLEVWLHRGGATAVGGQAVSMPAAEGLPVLPGIDVAEAMGRAQGKDKLFRRMLEEMLKWRDSAGRIRQALAAEDPPQARFLVHSLKGMSGTLAAGRVFHCCQELDEALRLDPAQDLEPMLQALEAALELVCEGVAGYLAAAATPMAGALPEASMGQLSEELRSRFAQLHRQCVDGDGDALELAHLLAAELAGTSWQGPLARMVAQLDAFDFQLAAKQLEKWLAPPAAALLGEGA